MEHGTCITTQYTLCLLNVLSYFNENHINKNLMLVTNAADYFFFLGIQTYFSQQMYLKKVRLIIAIWLTKGIVCQRIAEIGSLLKS